MKILEVEVKSVNDSVVLLEHICQYDIDKELEDAFSLEAIRNYKDFVTKVRISGARYLHNQITLPLTNDNTDFDVMLIHDSLTVNFSNKQGFSYIVLINKGAIPIKVNSDLNICGEIKPMSVSIRPL